MKQITAHKLFTDPSKINVKARHATNSLGIALLEEVAQKVAKRVDGDLDGEPVQLYKSCGSNHWTDVLCPFRGTDFGFGESSASNAQYS